MTPLDYAKQICYSSEETLMFTYEMAKKYANTPGVYVECGVAAGAQIIAMAYGAPNKIIYAFDSFEGIPLPSNKDDQYPGIKVLSKEEQSNLPDPGEQLLESSGATTVGINDFWDHIEKALGDFGLLQVEVVKGWFEETLQRLPWYVYNDLRDGISILRLDGDLYNSTSVCLKYLFPKVINGGLVIIDDWNLPGCRKAVFDYFGGELKYPMQFVSNIAYFIKS